MVDTPRPPRSTLTMSEDAARRAQFSDRPPYQKPGYKPGGNFRPSGGAGGPRKRPETADPDLLKRFPRVLEKGQTEADRIYLAVRRDSVGWYTPASQNPKKQTLIGLRNAGASAVPVDVTYDDVDAWWSSGYPLTVKKV